MKKSPILLIIIIIFLAIFLRFYRLGQTPQGFYTDEAAIGYNAWSILKTGKDEFSQSFPLLFRSFADFKAPIYTYLLVPIYSLIGMTVWSTRFLSALSGVIAIFFFYLLVKKVSKNNRLSLISALLLAISPWHILFSRTTYETNLALTFLIISLWSFYKSQEKPWWYLICGLSAVLSFLSYHSERVIIPLLFLALFIRHFSHILSPNNRKWLIFTLIISLIIILPTARLFTTSGFRSRLSTLSIFSKTTRVPWGYQPNLSNQNNFLNNRPLLLSREWTSLYLSYFSPRYLFKLGDSGPRSSYPDLATFYLWQLPFWLLGLSWFLKKEKPAFSELKFLTGLLLFITPIPASITGDPYSAIRALPMVLPLVIIISSGMKLLLQKFGSKIIYLYIFLVFISLGRIYLSVFKINDYFRYKSWDYGAKQLVEELTKLGTTPIQIDNVRGELYTQILFFSRFDPSTYQQHNFEVKPNDYYVNLTRNTNKVIGTITLKPLIWGEILSKQQVLVGDEYAISNDQIKNHCLTRLFEIRGPDNTLLFTGVRTNPELKQKFNQNNNGSSDCSTLVK